MGILKTGISAIGKLFIVAALAGTFIVGMVSVVYLSLSGEEVKVPEIIGKNFLESEKELTQLGLKVKRRALRYSNEKPNTVLEQLPRPGETVKTGQTILVVLSQANPEGEEAPATIVKDKEEEEVETAPDLEIPSDKKKVTKNSNVKKATTTRDVEKSNSNSNSNAASNSNSSNNNQSGAGSKANTATPTAPANKTNPATPNTKTIIIPSASPKPNNTPKPVAAKTPVTGGDVRTRRVN